MTISIHTPRVGGDELGDDHHVDIQISIHTPRVGGDVHGMSLSSLIL